MAAGENPDKVESPELICPGWRYSSTLPNPLDIDESRLAPSVGGTSGGNGTSAGSSDLEQKSEANPRSHIFLGRPMSVAHELAFFIVVATANFTPHSGFHQTLCILREIGDDIGAVAPGQLVWTVAAYGLSVGTLILPAGRLGDLYGHRRLFLLGNLWFALASLLAGLAAVCAPPRQRYAAFVVARALQGIGPAVLVPNAVALLGVTYVPGPRKAMLFAVFGAMAPASAVVSPAVTGLIALAWWPCAFWALALVLALVAAAGLYVIPADEERSHHHGAGGGGGGGGPAAAAARRRGGFRGLCAELDVLGALTGVTGLVLISVAWIQSTLAGWGRPYVGALLVLGLGLCAAFACVEARARKPLIPLEAINSGVALVLAAVFCGWGCFSIYIYYIWSFYEVLRGATPLLATAWHSPILVSGVAAALTFGLVVHRVGPAVVMALALLAFAAGSALIATAPIAQTYWSQTFLCNLVITWGMDLSFPAATLMLSDLVAAEHQGIAASLVTTVVNYSGALALGVAGTVAAHAQGEGQTPEDVLRGYRGAWYVGIGLAVCGLVFSLVFVWRFSKRQKGMMG
ncbi:major facilitator superfamily transporter [Xylariaceae sp. FL0804]|nr:major facilitator superfamily transporter [Xylariaceae sp. FL0804]